MVPSSNPGSRSGRRENSLPRTGHVAAGSAPPLQALSPASAFQRARPRQGRALGLRPHPTLPGPPPRSMAPPLTHPSRALRPLVSRVPVPSPPSLGRFSRPRLCSRAPPPRALGSPGEELPRGRRRGRGAGRGAGGAAGTLALTPTGSGSRALLPAADAIPADSVSKSGAGLFA